MRNALLLALAVACAATVAATALGTSATAARKGVAFDDAFVIVLENHGASSVYGDPNMPYLTSLARTYAFAPNYYGVAHPSEPNYVALISGSTWGIEDDNPENTVAHANIAVQLQRRHLTWRGYMESLPRAGDVTDAQYPADAPLYVKKHDPFALFPDITSRSTRANIKPLSDLTADLSSGHVGNFALIVPNLCDDLHGGSACPSSSANDDPSDVALKRKADAFLRTWVGAIMSSKVWKTSRVAIFVVADEDDSSGDNRVGAAVVTNSGHSKGFTSAKRYNHYSLLATLEWNWRLPYLEQARRARPLTAFFPVTRK